ncbi:MAG: alpha/beta fold hydrolase [Neisseriaceae bacterium]|nr:alpha/beta fold hydrolase [Neisseriaceae bacterium]MBP6862142.1 alpha/beta fold hydrolase [Neisseriaceae bacterium]
MMQTFTFGSGQRLAYERHGDEGQPMLVLVHPLGMNRQVWAAVVPALCQQFQVLSIDLPGHGDSAPCVGRHLRMADLAHMVLALVADLGQVHFHYVGTSIGGAIGQSLLQLAPERLLSLTLTNTAPKIGTKEAWLSRAAAVRVQGLSQMAKDLVPRWFAAVFLQQQPEVVASWVAALGRMDDDSYAQLCEALAYFDGSHDWMNQVAQPVTLMAGQDDAAMPLATMQAMAEAQPLAELVILPVGHVPSLEHPEVFLNALMTTALMGAVVQGDA